MDTSDPPTVPDREPPQLPLHVAVGADVVWQALEGQVVLLELNSGHYYTLDDVGSRMWQALVESPDTAVAQQRLTEEFEVDPATLKRDLAELVAQMTESRILLADSGPAATT
jgi:hypothetical protein